MAESRLAGRFPWRGPLVFGAERPVRFLRCQYPSSFDLLIEPSGSGFSQHGKYYIVIWKVGDNEKLNSPPWM